MQTLRTRNSSPLLIALLAGVILPFIASASVVADPLDPVLGDPGRTLPNLVPNVVDVEILRMLVFDEATQTFVPGAPRLFFDTHAQNLGKVPLQLTFGGIDDPETAVAEQCLSWRRADAYVCREQQEVGGFSWHAPHTHFHFNDFAEYELRHVRRNGRVNYSLRGLIAASNKVSFCLVDSQSVTSDAAPVGVYRTCSPTVEGVSPGWTDIYSPTLDGQQLSLDGLSDGRYALVIRMDHGNRLFETTDADNVLEAILEISGGVTTVSIIERRYPGAER